MVFLSIWARQTNPRSIEKGGGLTRAIIDILLMCPLYGDQLFVDIDSDGVSTPSHVQLPKLPALLSWINYKPRGITLLQDLTKIWLEHALCVKIRTQTCIALKTLSWVWNDPMIIYSTEMYRDIGHFTLFDSLFIVSIGRNEKSVEINSWKNIYFLKINYKYSWRGKNI